jgi:acetolactate synthase-1/2/3 large subunit
MSIHGGELVAEALARAGCKHIFGLHGGHVDPIFQACHDAGIRIIDTRHEQAAGHMADAWGRLTGRPGVAVVTAGPGVTDIVTAVANAYMDAVPMIVIGGRYPLADDEMMPLQELHGVPLMQSITKWSRVVRDTERIGEYVDAAFHQATSGRPGPVFLEMPADTLANSVDEATVPAPAYAFDSPSRPRPSADAVARVLEALVQAERPLILAGRGVWLGGAAGELREFAEMTGTPVIANGFSRGAVPEGTALGLGGFLGAGRALALGARPDLVLMLGARYGLFTGGRQSIVPPEARVIQVDIVPEELGRGGQVEIAVAADVRETLQALIAASIDRSWPSRETWHQAAANAAAMAKTMIAASAQSPDGKTHPFTVASAVANVVKEGGVLSVDGGDTFVWAELALEAQRPGRYLGHGYLGCLGIGLPFALAARLAYPDEPSILLTGDGSVGLNFAEFDTAVRHDLPITVVVNNDQAWGMCKHEQMVRLGAERVIATELGMVHYEKAAEPFGVYGEFVEDAAGIEPAIRRAIASGRPSCVNVITDPNAISPAQQASAVAHA